jgi:predicted alpha/beta superfamily hydrolase
MYRLIRTLAFGTLFSFSLTCAYGQRSTETIRWFEMRGTEIREIHSKITNQDYELIINLPYSYRQDTTKRYPAVYFCDGFYDFALLSMIYADQIFDQTIRECFLVGFSYRGKDLDYGKLRTHDYTPTTIKQFPGTGGGPDFLKVVENEFIPFMEKNYRVDPSFRVLGGSSLGGLFVLYAMFTQTNLFNAYIAISPAVGWDNGWLFNTEEEFHARHTDLPVLLYMTGAEKEFADRPAFLEGIKFFGEVLKKRNYEHFRYQFRVLDDAYHASSKPEGYTRGMQFIFAPLVKKQEPGQ